MRSNFPGRVRARLRLAGELFIEDLVDEARFAGAGHAGHAGKGAERELDVDVAQVIFRRAEDFQGFSVARPPLFGQGDLLCAGQILARDGARGGNDIVDGARGDDLAAVHARAGADVDDEVGGAHGILVMLDDEHGVAESRRWRRVSSSLSLSRWCRPMDGSSRIYRTPMRLEPICVASRMRWLSPPDRVAAERESVR